MDGLARDDNGYRVRFRNLVDRFREMVYGTDEPLVGTGDVLDRGNELLDQGGGRRAKCIDLADGYHRCERSVSQVAVEGSEKFVEPPKWATRPAGNFLSLAEFSPANAG